MNLDKCCIFCGNDKITISMGVTVDGSIYNVGICSEHEDDASPKAVRTKLAEELEAIANAKALLEKFGYIVRLKSAQPQAQQPQAQQPQAQQPQAQQPQAQQPQAQQPQAQQPQAQQPQAQQPQAQQPQAQQPQAPKIVSKEMQDIHTSSTQGNRIAIPRRIIDEEGGSTDIRIVNTDDRAIQRRFKNIAAQSKSNSGPDFRHQYSIADCPMCKGSGISPVNKKPCPKCGGSGNI